MLCSRLKIPVFARLCSFTLVFDDLHAITYHPEGCFMQNKPNSSAHKYGAKHFSIRIYERFHPLVGRKNKPNQTQFKANTNPIAEKLKMNVRNAITRNYNKIPRLPGTKTNPIQTQFYPRCELTCFPVGGQTQLERSASPELVEGSSNLPPYKGAKIFSCKRGSRVFYGPCRNNPGDILLPARTYQPS